MAFDFEYTLGVPSAKASRYIRWDDLSILLAPALVEGGGGVAYLRRFYVPLGLEA